MKQMCPRVLEVGYVYERVCACVSVVWCEGALVCVCIIFAPVGVGGNTCGCLYLMLCDLQLPQTLLPNRLLASL